MEIKMSLIPGGKPGKVGKVNVKPGDKVTKDQELMNVETGKGNRIIKASLDGVIKEVKVAEGSDVKSNEVLVLIDEVSNTLKEDVEIKMSLIPGGKPGTVGKVNVKTGDKVSKDQELMNVETGKGNRIIKASKDGVIKEVKVAEGANVKSNELLVVLEVECEVEKEEVSTSKKKEELTTDLLILGAGPGGYVAALYAAKKGLKVTIVEKNKLGGTCLNVGCIPTKALVKSSEVYYEALNTKDFGIDLDGSVSYKMSNIIDHKEKIVNQLVGGIDSLLKSNNVQVLKGNAKFVNNTLVSVETSDSLVEVSYKDVIIATGSKIAKPRFSGMDLDCVLNSTTCLSNRENLDSITIVGGGVIGMEFACLFANLGTKVTVIEFLPQVLAMLDDDVISEFIALAKEKKIEIHTSSAVKDIKQAEDGKAVVTYTKDNQEYIVVSDKVLVATGRLPEVEGLDLDKTDVKLNDNGRGIKVDSHMKTNVDHIYAIGDVTNIIQLAHVASHQGLCAVDNILGEVKEMDYHAVPSVTFTDPEIASVGLSEKECKKQGIEYKVGKFSYSGNGKALTMNKPEGFCKLIKDVKTNVVIGGVIIGADASSLVSTLAVAIANNLTDEEINHTIFAHPTTTEVIMEASLDLGLGALHQ